MASAQQHRILRQVLQLEGCSRQDAQPLGDALQGLYLTRLLPVIEAACDALAAPGELLRIDKLEIDLGALPWAVAAELTATAAERLSVALPSRLAQAAQATPAHQSAAELLGHFACTGTLLWWADATDRRALAKAFEQLLAAPAAARDLLRRLAGRADAWRRLLPYLGDPLGQGVTGSTASANAAVDAALDAAVDAGVDTALDRLLLCLHTDWPALAGARMAGLAAALHVAPDANPAARARLRLRWWPPLLASAGDGQVPAQLLALALDHLADQTDTPAARLWQAWRAGSDWQQPAARQVALVLDRRWAAPGLHSPPARAGGPTDQQGLRRADDLLVGLLQSWADAPGGRALWGRLAGVLGQLPPSLRRAAGGTASDPEAHAAAVAALVDAARNQGLLAPEIVQEGLQAAAGQGGQGGQGAQISAAAVAARLRAGRAAVQPGTPPDLADALFVDNAGLVLLWPFLGSFFERLGLLNGRSFAGDAAAQSAARLLHFLASGDPDPAEHQLPLCKLLCGLDLLAPIDPIGPIDPFDPLDPLDPFGPFGPLDLLDPLDPGTPAPEAQQAEAHALLAAVIEQAGCLGGLSADGFRGSFLLRRGQLSAVDGHHLLRVERESWDVVLGRLPWHTGFVKLPWMAALLQVEW